jgi:hypothetical protein
MAALRNAAIGVLRTAGVTNIAANVTTTATALEPWHYSASPDDFAGALIYTPTGPPSRSSGSGL